MGGYHLLAMGPTYDSDPLSLSFLICEVVILTALPSESSCEDSMRMHVSTLHRVMAGNMAV